MYLLKEDKKEELKKGRTFTYIAEKTGLTDRYIKAIFAGSKCKKITAMTLISVRHEISVTSSEMEKYLSYYFNTDEEED